MKHPFKRPQRARKAPAKRGHWCSTCKGKPFVYGPEVLVDTGQGPKLFPQVIQCPNKAKPQEGLDRQSKAAGETETRS